MNFFWEWETKSINNYYNNNSYVFLYICNCNFIGPDATPENVKKMAKVGMFSDAHLGTPCLEFGVRQSTLRFPTAEFSNN